MAKDKKADIIMKSRVTGTEVLICLENFVNDTNLPKHKQKKDEQQGFISFGNTPAINVSGGTLAGQIWGDAETSWIMQSNIEHAVKQIIPEKFAKKLFSALNFGSLRSVDPITMFTNFKQGSKELEVVSGRLEEYNNAISHALNNGQEALADELKRNIPIIQLETELVALKQTTFIEEDVAVRFIKESKRGVKLDYLKNFARIIPDKVMQVKNKMDEHNIFDNYVILHYDPNDKGSMDTKKEKERKKDPIMYGLIKDSRRLYFIGDWIDEHCDLTLDGMAKVIGKENIKALQSSAIAPIKPAKLPKK